MDRLKSLITVLLASIIVGFFIWAVLPRDDFNKNISEQLKDEKFKADVIFKEATLAEIYDGIKYWELVARSSSINKSIGVAKLSSVNGLFYDKGRPTIKFLAPSAIWYINKNEIYLNDPIGYDIKSENVINEELKKVKDLSQLNSVFHLPDRRTKGLDGYWFQAKNLNWKLSTKKLLCTGAISLTKGNAIISADRLEGDVGLEKVLLTGNPSAEITSNGEKIVTSAKEFLVDSRSDIIVADRDVKISRGASQITASRSVYDQKDDIAQLAGDVNIADNQIIAFAKSANYDVKNAKIVLIGKAKAKRAENEVYGDKMTILIGRNKILVEGRTKVRVKESELK